MACFKTVELEEIVLPDEILLQIDKSAGFCSFTAVLQIVVAKKYRGYHQAQGRTRSGDWDRFSGGKNKIF